jgi:hypothetical protein
MVQTFDDEFNTRSISADGVANGTLWNDHIWFDSSHPNLSTVQNGILNLTTDGSDSWAANIQTTNSAGQGFSQKFGYF